MSSQSLLPDNRTPLETALEKSLAKQLQNIESPYPQLWDPAQVKPTLLPYLAHAKGVPDWGEDTDAAKRDTVANIWTVQRQAGTRQAVKQAVDALGFDAEVTRGEEPYRLQIDLWREDVGSVESDFFARAERRIEQVKSERDIFSINVNLKTASQVSTSSFALSADQIDIHPYSLTDLDNRGKYDIGIGAMIFDRINVFPEEA